MTLTRLVTENIIRKLLKGEDYRIEIVNLINAEFLQFAIDFFKKIALAKLDSKDITIDWYKNEFLDEKLSKQDIAIYSGLNMKTIHNMHKSSAKKIVIDASIEHFESLYNSIKELTNTDNEVDLTLTIKLNSVSVDLNVAESLIVINTIAVKRAGIRGGLWSTAGKRVEKPLMETLCMLYNVPKDNYASKIKGKKKKKNEFEREIDFYLISNETYYKCEVKLMGSGNPESADAVIARGSKVFIADKLSEETNINQLNSLNVEWVELRRENGFKRFKTVLENLDIPHSDISPDYESHLTETFNRVFQK